MEVSAQQPASYRGHVDVATKQLISGWALNVSNLDARPLVEVWQSGKLITSVAPSLPAPQLLQALKIDSPAHKNKPFTWQIPFPLMLGLNPDEPFKVCFGSTRVPLGAGERVIPTIEVSHPEVENEFQREQFLILEYDNNGTDIEITARCYFHRQTEPSILLNGRQIDVEFSLVKENALKFAGRDCHVCRFRVGPDRLSRGKVVVSLPSRRDQPHDKIREVSIPEAAFGAASDNVPIPALENIRRVSGPSSTQLGYLIGGKTTFDQLNALAREHFGKDLSEFKTIVDWGVGCARVMRHFDRRATAKLIGVDIDKVNIDWCRANCNGKIEFQALDKDAVRLPAQDHTVDLLYGISVMTHLTEYHQFRWLEELRRVMKPGGAIVLTTHGEFFYYQRPRSLFTPLVEKFGFFDGVPDIALGQDMATYYRSTFHSRSYVKENWGRYFEILDVVPGANAFVQDFIIMRAPPPQTLSTARLAPWRMP